MVEDIEVPFWPKLRAFTLLKELLNIVISLHFGIGHVLCYGIFVALGLLAVTCGLFY